MRLSNLKTIRLNTFLSAGRVAQTIDPRHPDSGRVIKFVLLGILCIVTPAEAQYSGVTGVIGSVPSGPASNEVLRLTLRDGINMALRYNLGAIESGGNTQITRGQRLIALSNLLPQVSAGVSENVAQTSLATLGIKRLPGVPNVLGPYSYSSVPYIRIWDILIRLRQCTERS
jgi:hypothetical protein